MRIAEFESPLTVASYIPTKRPSSGHVIRISMSSALRAATSIREPAPKTSSHHTCQMVKNFSGEAYKIACAGPSPAAARYAWSIGSGNHRAKSWSTPRNVVVDGRRTQTAAVVRRARRLVHQLQEPSSIDVHGGGRTILSEVPGVAKCQLLRAVDKRNGSRAHFDRC